MHHGSVAMDEAGGLVAPGVGCAGVRAFDARAAMLVAILLA